MIATVTLNPAIDKTVAIPGFGIGKTNRATLRRIDAGGKGINVAKAARQMGCPVIALGFLAGNNGTTIGRALAAQGIPADFVSVAGETRVNLKIVDPETGSETEINEAGFPVTPAELAELELRVDRHAANSRIVIFSGSLPLGASDDTYARLIEIATRRGARTILDTGGKALQIGLAAAPALVKPNRAEAEAVLGREIGEACLREAAETLRALGPAGVVISLGADGAVGATSHGCWRARPPAMRTASSVGSGDAMVAALARSMLAGDPFDEALRFAVSAGSASAALDGTAVAGLAEMEQLLPDVLLEELRETAGVKR